MSDRATLSAQKRTIFGKSVRSLRRQGMLPANVSGHNRESLAIQIDAHAFEQMLKDHGSSTLITLNITPGGIKDTALIARVEHDPVSRAIQHVDFRHVELSEPIRARVPLHLEGESPAVRIENGVLLHPIDTIEVEALPTNLPEALTLDLSGLTELGSSLYARDIKAPSKVTILTNPDEVVVTIQAPRIAIEETTVAEPEDVTPLIPPEEPTENAGASA